MVYIYIYIYIYVCVCVCVCAYVRARACVCQWSWSDTSGSYLSILSHDSRWQGSDYCPDQWLHPDLEFYPFFDKYRRIDLAFGEDDNKLFYCWIFVCLDYWMLYTSHTLVHTGTFSPLTTSHPLRPVVWSVDEMAAFIGIGTYRSGWPIERSTYA